MRINEVILKVNKHFVINQLIMYVIVCCDFVGKNIKWKIDYKKIKAVNMSKRMEEKQNICIIAINEKCH